MCLFYLLESTYKWYNTYLSLSVCLISLSMIFSRFIHLRASFMYLLSFLFSCCGLPWASVPVWRLLLVVVCGGPSPVMVPRLLIAVASLVASRSSRHMASVVAAPGL